MQSADFEFPPKPAVPSKDLYHETATLTPREALELFQNAVDNARQGIQSLAGNTKAAEVARPKLTLDLKHCRLDRIPSEVVDIIKQDVERYGAEIHNHSRPLC